MKKICLISAVALLCLVSCTSDRQTELKGSNLQYEVWSSEKIFALLPDQAKAAVCDFNDDYRNIDSVSAVFTECSTTTHIYKSKSGTVLKDDSMECQTPGTSFHRTLSAGNQHDHANASVLRGRSVQKRVHARSRRQCPGTDRQYQFHGLRTHDRRTYGR